MTNSLSNLPLKSSSIVAAFRFVRLLAVFLLLGLSGFSLAQSICITSPYQRQSFAYGTLVPVNVSITTVTAASVSSVEMYTLTGSTSVLVGTSSTAPYTNTITVTIPSTGSIELKAKLTLSNSNTYVSGGRIINGLASSTCNTGANVKRFYVKAGATTTGTLLNAA